MSYSLFRLRFKTAVHLGTSDSALSLSSSEDHFRADTLFSALCHTALTLYGPEGLDLLIRQAQSGELLLSDSMPWKDETLYLPKPCYHARQRQEVPAALRKAMKRLRWIPVPDFVRFTGSFHGEAVYDAAESNVRFGTHDKITRANAESGIPTLYQVGIFQFAKDCGLWFLARCGTAEQEERLYRLVTALGMSGIGGKTSSGYGRFEIVEHTRLSESEQPQHLWLRQALVQENASHYLLLTSSLPAEDELDGVVDNAWFQVVRRAGYVQSETYAPVSLRKRTQYFLAAGAVTDRRFRGSLYDVGGTGGHPVYRYSLPIMMGVSL